MGEYGFEKMKKAQLVSLAYDFWRSIEKSKAEIERQWELHRKDVFDAFELDINMNL